MSTYEYYEFLALDRPLTSEEQSAVREFSTRAEITATSFTNEYHWGEFKGDPYKLVTRYYDAHLHYADWGTREVILKLPRKAVDAKAVEQYWADGGVAVTTSSKYVVLDFTYQLEEPDYDDEDVWDQKDGGLRFDLSTIAAVRSEIASGDLRALYIAWLAAYGRWEVEETAFPPDDEDRLEPPVPAGLRSLSAPQRALAEVLKLDADLLAVAAESSPHRQPAGTGIPEAVAALTEAKKDELLHRVASGEGGTVRLELLRAAKQAKAKVDGAPAGATPGQRTVGELLDAAAERRQGSWR